MLEKNLKKIKTKIIGNNKIGDKARQLIKKTKQLNETGFYTSERIILSENCFDEFFIKNRFGKSFQNPEKLNYLDYEVKKGIISRDLLDLLKNINDEFGRIPIAVRSSAGGDSRGTGIYETRITENNIFSLKDAIRNVLGSYYSESAIKFRENSNAKKEFGIIIEPLIGQKLDEGFCFAPVLSGFGYTSTPREGAYLSIVPGLGGGVDSRNGEKITSKFMKKADIKLREYIFWERDKILSFSSKIRNKRKSALLGTGRDYLYSGEGYSAKAYFFGEGFRKEGVYPTTINFEGKLKENFENLKLKPFFEKIESLEQEFGKPQYIEWAMTFENKKPKYWITQISDVNKKIDMIDFGDLENILFQAYDVVGTGEMECDKIFLAWNPGKEIGNLYEFNQKNKNYVLLFSSRLTSGAIGLKLPYSCFSNASAFLEIQDAPHGGNPAEHLMGQLDCSGKIFGVLDYDKNPNWGLFDKKSKEINGSKIYTKKVKVVGSEKQDKMIVSAID